MMTHKSRYDIYFEKQLHTVLNLTKENPSNFNVLYIPVAEPEWSLVVAKVTGVNSISKFRQLQVIRNHLTKKLPEMTRQHK